MSLEILIRKHQSLIKQKFDVHAQIEKTADKFRYCIFITAGGSQEPCIVLNYYIAEELMLLPFEQEFVSVYMVTTNPNFDFGISGELVTDEEFDQLIIKYKLNEKEN